ncbi:hypothetical protein TNCV_61091 [Trichonephila clavipes]|nr:hypothetical protein TNCV_61091 [Trichonephila clavipes]
MANLLTKEDDTEVPVSSNTPKFSEVCSKIKITNRQLCKIPPIQPRYKRQALVGALTIKTNSHPASHLQTCIRCLSFVNGQKT